MKKSIIVTLIFICGFSQIIVAQNKPVTPEKYTAHNKGKFFVYWGGNRDSFTRSDIRFTGDGYDFTLNDVQAVDKPKGWHVDYINPSRMTIPQTDFRMGYYITDHYNIAIGVDHMKYVMIPNQIVNINGTIAGNPPFNGTYNNESISVTEDFLTFEHTDGLNYIHTEFSRVDDFSWLFKIRNTDKFQVNLTEGIGAGILFPKTNAKVMGNERHDDFHVSGYGVSAKVGLNLTFFKYFFLQAELKSGYINMPDIRTTKDPSDRASQHFMFVERIIAFGGIFKV